MKSPWRGRLSDLPIDQMPHAFRRQTDDGPIHKELAGSEGLTIARIVRVNHAGEFGAIRIYSAQIVVSRWFWPDCVAALVDMLEDERRHCDLFFDAMPERKSRPCRVMRFW